MSRVVVWSGQLLRQFPVRLAALAARPDCRDDRRVTRPWLAALVVLCGSSVLAGAQTAGPLLGDAVTAPKGRQAPPGMVWIPARTFIMGSQNGEADAPCHRVSVDGFWLDATEVTNAQFVAFVAATGYVTDAERKPTPEEVPGVPAAALIAGALVFRPPEPSVDKVDLREFWRWWQFLPGANWRQPDGPGSSIDGKDQHPVVQVSWRDAVAYCQWAGKRLPTEAEWECAARGGLSEMPYVWGRELTPGGVWPANIWQGPFPRRNDQLDGHAATAPVRSYPPNAFGIYEISGNVWEWVADYYRPDGYGDPGELQVNPRGPASSFDPAEPGLDKRVMRGGSFLCNDVYCRGYQPGTRMKSSPDTSLCHTGFRCARDADSAAESSGRR